MQLRDTTVPLAAATQTFDHLASDGLTRSQVRTESDTQATVFFDYTPGGAASVLSMTLFMSFDPVEKADADSKWIPVGEWSGTQGTKTWSPTEYTVNATDTFRSGHIDIPLSCNKYKIGLSEDTGGGTVELNVYNTFYNGAN